MTASERLRELEKIDYFDVHSRLRVLDALPEIIAVVEEAEKVWTGQSHDGITFRSYLAVALAALDEKLAP
jgi:hypothetical protein